MPRRDVLLLWRKCAVHCWRITSSPHHWTKSCSSLTHVEIPKDKKSLSCLHRTCAHMDTFFYGDENFDPGFGSPKMENVSSCILFLLMVTFQLLRKSCLLIKWKPIQHSSLFKRIWTLSHVSLKSVYVCLPEECFCQCIPSHTPPQTDNSRDPFVSWDCWMNLSYF